MKFSTVFSMLLLISPEYALRPAKSQTPPQTQRPAIIQCPSPATKLELMRQGHKVDGCTITLRPKSSLPKIREKAR